MLLLTTIFQVILWTLIMICHYVLGNPQFDPNDAIDTMRTHNLTFPFWDPIHDNITISRTVDLTGEDLVEVARDICEEYTRGELSAIDDTAMLRCLSPTLKTLRMTKAHGISLLSRMFETIPFDEEIYGLLAGYEGLYKSGTDSAEREEDDRGTDAREDMIHQVNADGNLSPCRRSKKTKKKDYSHDTKGLTACVIGVPTAHTLLPALFTKPISQVIVYSSIFDETDATEDVNNNFNNEKQCHSVTTSKEIQRLRSESDQASWNYFYANEIAKQINKSLYYHSMNDLLTRIDSSEVDSEMDPLTRCDIIQLNPDHECESLFANIEVLTRGLQILTTDGPVVEQRSSIPTLTDESLTLDDMSRTRSTLTIRLQHLVHTLENGTEITHFYDSPETLWSRFEQDERMKTELIQARYLNHLIYIGELLHYPEAEILQRTTDDLTEETFQVHTIYSDREGHWYEMEYYYGKQYELSVISIGKYNNNDHAREIIESMPSSGCEENIMDMEEVVSQHNRGTNDDERFDRSLSKEEKHKVIVIVITWSIPIFVETTLAMAQSIAANREEIIGHLNMVNQNQNRNQISSNVDLEIYMSAEMSVSVYQYLQEQSDLVIHIPVSTVDESTLFTKHSIMYNSEQVFYTGVFSTRGLMRYKYMFYQHHTMLWSYDQVSMEHFRDHVFKEMHSSESDRAELESRLLVGPYVYSLQRQEVLRKLFYKNYSESLQGYAMPLTRIEDSYHIVQEIPMRIHNVFALNEYFFQQDNQTIFLSKSIETQIYEDEIKSHQHHKVIFFSGSCPNRRGEILTQLELHYFASYFHDRFLSSSDNIKFYSLCTRVFAYHYDYYIMKAKIVINIGSYYTSIFETHRINHLLSMGKVIVSEMGANTSIAERYADGVILVPNAEDPKNISMLLTAIDSMIHNETAMELQSRKAHAFYRDTILKKDRLQLIQSMVKTINFFLS